QLIWSSYLQGSNRNDVYGIAVDSSGDVYVTGWTLSSDFPTTAGAYKTTGGASYDVFVTKFYRDGSHLVWSTFLGGGGTDQCRGGMTLDPSGRVIVTGYTESTNFPTTTGAYQRTNRGGGGDVFVSVLSADGSTLEHSTLLGSTGPDLAFAGLVRN